MKLLVNTLTLSKSHMGENTLWFDDVKVEIVCLS